MRRRGFSLIETIIGASILALIIVFVFEVYPTSILGIKKAENRVLAGNIGGNLLEAMRSQGFDSLTVGSTVIPDAATNGMVGFQNGVTSRNGTDFSCSIAIQAVAGADPKLLKDIKVTVTWPEKVARSTSAPVIQQMFRETMVMRVP